MFIDQLKNKTIHFIGVSGSGMIAICQFLKDLEFCTVTGSDLNQTKAIKKLIKKGLMFYNNHHEDHVKDADIVVYSSAIPEDNPERQEANRLNKTLFHRAVFLVQLMDKFTNKVAVAGTHGKTTSTAMLINIFNDANLEPSFCLGGELNNEQVNGKFNQREHFIVETDESDGSFLEFTPNYSIITNIECDHMNFFKSQEDLAKTFSKFIKKGLTNNGFIALNRDDPILNSNKKLLKNEQVWTFSTYQKATCTAKNIEYSETGSSFDLYYKDNFVDKINLNSFGIHNVYNALGVCCVSLKFGITIKSIKNGLSRFSGVKRRLQLVKECKGIKIYDDYGHHPTAIKSTLEALKKASKSSLICVFQPHRFSRTHDLITDFSKSFSHADKLIITDIYSANEENIYNVSSETLVDLVKQEQSNDVCYVQKQSDIINKLRSESKKGDIILFMGAGDINNMIPSLVDVLNK